MASVAAQAQAVLLRDLVLPGCVIGCVLREFSPPVSACITDNVAACCPGFGTGTRRRTRYWGKSPQKAGHAARTAAVQSVSRQQAGRLKRGRTAVRAGRPWRRRLRTCRQLRRPRPRRGECATSAAARALHRMHSWTGRGSLIETTWC